MGLAKGERERRRGEGSQFPRPESLDEMMRGCVVVVVIAACCPLVLRLD